MIMNFRVQLDRAPTMMKTRQENDMTKHTSAVYAKNETKLLCLIKSSMVCDENQI